MRFLQKNSRFLLISRLNRVDVGDGGLAVGFQNVGEGLGLDGDGTAHEFGNVVTLEQLAVVVGVGAGQFKGFGGPSVGVDVGDKGTSEPSVVAAAAENHPPAVARP